MPRSEPHEQQAYAIVTGMPGPGDAGPSWLTALGDPVASSALAPLHRRPVDAGLLCEVSRATLARRFAVAVGKPPLAYLARWRMDGTAHWILRFIRPGQRDVR